MRFGLERLRLPRTFWGGLDSGSGKEKGLFSSSNVPFIQSRWDWLERDLQVGKGGAWRRSAHLGAPFCRLPGRCAAVLKQRLE